MLGQAEWREIDETLNSERPVEAVSTERSNAYITPFGMGLAMTRAMTGSVKPFGFGFGKR